jgi:hypothetical protein
VVVVEVIGERLSSHAKGDVLLFLDHDLRKRATDLDDSTASLGIGVDRRPLMMPCHDPCIIPQPSAGNGRIVILCST